MSIYIDEFAAQVTVNYTVQSSATAELQFTLPLPADYAVIGFSAVINGTTFKAALKLNDVISIRVSFSLMFEANRL